MLKRLAARLPFTLATFLFSLFVTAALTPVTTTTNVPAPYSDPILIAKRTPAAPPNSPDSKSSRAADKPPRISQQEIVNFPGVGRVRVSAFETFEELTHLEFSDAKTGRLLYSESVGDDLPGPESQDRPFLRFSVLHIKGLPDPLVIGVGVTYGGSDDGWKSVAVGAINGELRELTSERLGACDEGGFYYGDLGRGRGFGAVSWDFIWGDEAHPDPHQYELKVYKWSPKSGRFEWYEVLRTRAKFDDGEEAVRSLGFNVRDVRKKFPDFADFWSE
jgi:hypothetical protein